MKNNIPVIAFVPREVFSTTEKCLRQLYEMTSEPFNLVCIDGNSDKETQSFLESFAEEKGFKLIRSDRYLPPNRARNMAYRWAKENTDADYIVFVDNDVLVSKNWLSALVKCADETGAGLVGPTYYEHLPECSKIHMFGGQCGLKRDEKNRLIYFEKHDCQHLPAAELTSDLVRKQTELIEFHTVLARMDMLEKIGGLDEALLCHAEHGDFSMTATKNGYEIWLEPEAKITYVPPQHLTREDRQFFFLRWSEHWMLANQQHFKNKWGLEHISNKHGRGLEWLRMHRSYGCQSIHRVRKLFGERVARFYRKKIFKPLEPKWNRFKYRSHP